MFTLVKDPTHWWPVSFDVPADGGTVETKTVELKFARISREEYRELWAKPMVELAVAAGPRKQVEGGDDTETAAAVFDVEGYNRRLFDRCVRGWRKIVDDEGSPVSFADPWISQMLNVGGFPEAFGYAYIQFWNAMPATIMGNSAPSPDGGQATADAAPAAATTTTEPRSQRRSGSGAPAKRT